MNKLVGSLTALFALGSATANVSATLAVVEEQSKAQYIVVFKESNSLKVTSNSAKVSSLGGEVKTQLRSISGMSVVLTQQQYQAPAVDPNVAFIEPDPVRQFSSEQFNPTRQVDVTWSDWRNSNTPTNCHDWTPEAGSIDWGNTFTQQGHCQQQQTRHRTYLLDNVDIAEITEQRMLDYSESRTMQGTRDYVIDSYRGKWTKWQDVGEPYNFGPWNRSFDKVKQGKPFVRKRNYKQDRQRLRHTFDVWMSGKPDTIQNSEVKTKTRTRIERQVRIGCRP